jgi:hypothetical protein
MLSHETRSRDADAASPASSAKARNANLDLRGDDRQDASRPRVAPDGAVPKARVGHHRDGQEQRKNTARDLRLAAVVGRPVASTHRRHGQSVSRPSLASGCPSPWKGCPHCASPAFTAGVVVRAARWSRAVSHGRRRAVARQRPSQPQGSGCQAGSASAAPRKTRTNSSRKGARLLVRPLRRVRGTGKNPRFTALLDQLSATRTRRPAASRVQEVVLHIADQPPRCC